MSKSSNKNTPKTPNTKGNGNGSSNAFKTPDSKFSEVTNTTIEFGPKHKVNLFLLCALMLGIGIIGGYVVFVFLHGSRCSTLMDAKQLTYSQSQQQIQERYLKSVEQYQKCLVDLNESSSRQITSDEGKHKNNGVLLEKHQDLMDRHQATVHQLMMVQSEHSENLVQQQTLSLNLERCEDRTRKLQNEKRKCQASKELMKQLVSECKSKEGAAAAATATDL
ncbi:unnamed protein product [Cylindrotheca closterium]|uniref:Uncharacterized protein n=1 Tax=Cylindrotheca closterium TaxID=2856 RepID=A0AAD2PU27_9STRA|nr:unnamed protein product [Cylindrotheca closterium]